jgi:energy-coupling factor transporter ATP-binding protein EcfA2
MSDLAIRVENLSKYYRIGALAQRHDTLRDHLVHTIQSLFGENGQSLGGEGKSLAPSERSSLNSQPSDRIWVIKGISFEVKHGEVVGVIGRNGTGKNTLLKILSRITEPTEGRAEIYGRIGSLLEVGTGFHPELTGRENIFLNGAILGMRSRKSLTRCWSSQRLKILSTHRSSTTRAGCMFAWHLPWRLIWTRIFLSWTRSLPLAIPPFRKNVWKKFKKWLATGEQYFRQSQYGGYH